MEKGLGMLWSGGGSSAQGCELVMGRRGSGPEGLRV